MPLCYKISPELNMILYVGEGVLKPSAFFALEKIAFLENRRQHNMTTLVDARKISTSFDMEDIENFIDNIKSLTTNGMEPGPYIMITQDWGIHLLAQAVCLMASKVDLNIHIFHTIEEAILKMGWLDQEQEIIRLWDECRTELSKLGANPLSLQTVKQT